MRVMTDNMSKQNTAPSQGDDAAASHIPCPTEPRIVPIVFEVEEESRSRPDDDPFHSIHSPGHNSCE